ncbi:MAG: 4-(cytidine 5'-diphospho)-2-C-methyl-D-erythritol kinase [Clostridia bacterium]|nr:4-(cytidine 5'-diphospho)-2-C-methyl-D-erythritol kinase [Clostridia bacterium]
MRTERANAKINLYLDVVSRRDNGYHNLVSLMQTVSLCDLVTVDFSPSSHTSIYLQASGNDAMPLDCRNLAWRAAELFLGTVRRSGEVRITIEKHIPMAAGLAGGSSDAAAVLRGLNRLCGEPLTLQELCDLGAGLGADIPFCIRGGGALVTGIGERMEDIPPMPDCPMVVACMGEGVSTPWAYGRLDEKYEGFTQPKDEDPRVKAICKALKGKKILQACEHFYNIFEDVVPQAQPCVDRLKNCMIQNNAACAMMSGSGPSVFGIFESVADADAACAALREMGAAAFVCHPCDAYRQ